MLRCCYRNHAKDDTHRRVSTHRRYRTGVLKKMQGRHDLIVLLHPHRRDGTGCDPSDVSPRLGAIATGHVRSVRCTVYSRFLRHAVSYTQFTCWNESSCFQFIGMAVVCSQPRIQHTYHSASHPSERWHRGCLKKTRTKRLIVFPHRYRRDDTHRRHRTGGCLKKRWKYIDKRHRTRSLPLITVIQSKLLSVVYPSAANWTQTVGRLSPYFLW